MANQICLTCNQPMRWQPAGISQRTGQHYNGFWSCPNRCPKPTYQKQPYQAPTPQILPKNSIPEPNWDRISFGKCKHAFLAELLKKDYELNEAELKAELWAQASMRIIGKPEVKNYGNGEELTEIPY